MLMYYSVLSHSGTLMLQSMEPFGHCNALQSVTAYIIACQNGSIDCNTLACQNGSIDCNTLACQNGSIDGNTLACQNGSIVFNTLYFRSI